MHDTTIREARLEDRRSVFELARQFATSFVVDERSFEATFPRLLADPSACLLVATTEDTVSGYLLGFEHPTFFANGPVAWVEEIMVAESQRRHGIGQQLMERFADWARGRDCRLIALATRRAASFYRALGYEESAEYFRKVL